MSVGAGDFLCFSPRLNLTWRLLGSRLLTVNSFERILLLHWRVEIRLWSCVIRWRTSSFRGSAGLRWPLFGFRLGQLVRLQNDFGPFGNDRRLFDLGLRLSIIFLIRWQILIWLLLSDCSRSFLVLLTVAGPAALLRLNFGRFFYVSLDWHRLVVQIALTLVLRLRQSQFKDIFSQFNRSEQVLILLLFALRHDWQGTSVVSEKVLSVTFNDKWQLQNLVGVRSRLRVHLQ